MTSPYLLFVRDYESEKGGTMHSTFDTHQDLVNDPNYFQYDVVVIIGLSGSGKSHEAKGLSQLDHRLFDEYCQHTPGNHLRRPDLSPKRDDLIRSILAGNKCVITDVQFCDAQVLDSLEADLRRNCPNVAIERIYYKNDPEQCKANLNALPNPPQHRLKAIDDYTHIYRPPDDAKPVYRSPSNMGN